MSEWKRTTKEVPFEQLPDEMVEAIRRHIDQYNLGPVLADALMCIQTDSVKKGFLGKMETVRMGVIATPRWLIWSVGQPGAKPTALSGQLINVTVQDYAQTPFAKMVHDSGVEVSGMFTDANESASAFIGLDESEVGKKFRLIAIKAAADAKK